MTNGGFLNTGLNSNPIHANFDLAALSRLSQVLVFWEGAGARFVSLPWVAPDEFVLATRPPHSIGQDVATPHGHLLASGEQAFCWLARQGVLDDHDCFIGWTPCFRDEPDFDATHHYGFLKAEVFAWCPDPDKERDVLHSIVATARKFMVALGGHSAQPSPLSDGTIDIELAGLEVGSYGIRDLPGSGSPRRYVYATALAEPRFGQALSLLAR